MSRGRRRDDRGRGEGALPRRRRFVAMELPPLEEGGDLERIPTEPPSLATSGQARAFPTLDPEPPPASSAVAPDPAGGPARAVHFPLLGSAAEGEPGERSPALLPAMSGGDPPSGLFILPPDGSWRGALRLRGAQLTIRVDRAAGLTLHQAVTAVLQLPHSSYVQLRAWVERVEPDCAVLVGTPDPGGLAELRQLLSWRRRSPRRT